MSRGYVNSRSSARRRRLCERTTSELLAEVWLRWRRDTWNGRPVTQSFSLAATQRLDASQPAWRTFASLLDRDVVKGRDTRSSRLDALRRLFVSGRSTLDDIPDEPEEAEEAPTALIAA